MDMTSGRTVHIGRYDANCKRPDATRRYVVGVTTAACPLSNMSPVYEIYELTSDNTINTLYMDYSFFDIYSPTHLLTYSPSHLLTYLPTNILTNLLTTYFAGLEIILEE